MFVSSHVTTFYINGIAQIRKLAILGGYLTSGFPSSCQLRDPGWGSGSLGPVSVPSVIYTYNIPLH